MNIQKTSIAIASVVVVLLLTVVLVVLFSFEPFTNVLYVHRYSIHDNRVPCHPSDGWYAMVSRWSINVCEVSNCTWRVLLDYPKDVQPYGGTVSEFTFNTNRMESSLSVVFYNPEKENPIQKSVLISTNLNVVECDNLLAVSALFDRNANIEYHDMQWDVIAVSCVFDDTTRKTPVVFDFGVYNICRELLANIFGYPYRLRLGN